MNLSVFERWIETEIFSDEYRKDSEKILSY